MDARHLFMDHRLRGVCAYCGGQPDTRDHVPSKALLDEPYPPQLPVVDACKDCNTGFSLDEQYLSCFLECVIRGTVEPSGLQRTNVKRILTENPALQERIRSSHALQPRIPLSQEFDELADSVWKPETDRVHKVVEKLARGHAAYELYPRLEEPIQLAFLPLPMLSDQQRAALEDIASGQPAPWPELGSRAFLRASGKQPDRFERVGDWIIVQPGRYRYAVIETGGVLVRMILSEYLACLVAWE